MDSTQARQILVLYRPGSTDAADPQVAEALDVAKHDPELAAWLEQHCAVYSAIHEKLRRIPVPADLKRKIIVERPPQPRAVPMKKVVWGLAAAAAVALMGTLIWNSVNAQNENSYAAYRTRMASRIQRGYYMEKAATNQTELREYFASKNGPVDYPLPKAVEQLASDGGSFFTFNNHPVELYCLRDPSVPGPTNEVWVFVIRKSDLPDAPKTTKPEYAEVDSMATLSWTQGNMLFLAVNRGNRKDLEKFPE